MAGPVKRSLSVAGHATSVSLEPVFWDALARAAMADGVSLAGLVARVDAARVTAPDPPNLSSALRVWVVERLLVEAGARSKRPDCEPAGDKPRVIDHRRGP